MKNHVSKYLVPLLLFAVFIFVGCIVWAFRDIRYLYLFAGIGFTDAITRILIIHRPKYRQFFRLLVQFIVGGFLLMWLSIAIGVNFQFPEIFFDAYAGVITGALIQLLIARILLPFFVGNAFCSRACWTGFFFEMTNKKSACKTTPMKRSQPLAFGYLGLLIAISLFTAYLWNPAEDIELRRWWIIGENLLIAVVGFLFSIIAGSRFYCRMLCPFLTISGLISPYAIFKVTPVKADDCIDCNLCTKACPMLIDVKEKVKKREKVSDNTCIACERCVSSCPKEVLKITHKTV